MYLDILEYVFTLYLSLQGLKETAHPYTFVAREGFITLCEIEGGMEKVMPLLARVLPPLRMALVSTAPLRMALVSTAPS